MKQAPAMVQFAPRGRLRAPTGRARLRLRFATLRPAPTSLKSKIGGARRARVPGESQTAPLHKLNHHPSAGLFPAPAPAANAPARLLNSEPNSP